MGMLLPFRMLAHTYDDVGTFTVSLTVSGALGSDVETKMDYIVVDGVPPTLRAEFMGTPTSGDAPLAVGFADLSTGVITSWAWNFGDGGSAGTTNVNYVYQSPGTFTVSLTVTNTLESNTETKHSYMTVQPAPPTIGADFFATPTGGGAPLAVVFTDQTTGTVSSWAWDFGEGGSDTTQDTTYTYLLPGTYTVSLSASGPAGTDVELKNDYVLVTGSLATATFRNGICGTNPTGYTASPPVIGQTWTASLDNTSTGNDTAQLIGFFSSLDVCFPFGAALVNIGDPGGELLSLPTQAGSALVRALAFLFPSTPAWSGLPSSRRESVSTISGGPISPTLHNAFDLVLGY